MLLPNLHGRGEFAVPYAIGELFDRRSGSFKDKIIRIYRMVRITSQRLGSLLAKSCNLVNPDNPGAPVKRASTRVRVPSVQLDGSAPQTVPTASPRGGVGSRHGIEPAGRNANEPQR
jgi:hypothetical protein